MSKKMMLTIVAAAFVFTAGITAFAQGCPAWPFTWQWQGQQVEGGFWGLGDQGYVQCNDGNPGDCTTDQFKRGQWCYNYSGSWVSGPGRKKYNVYKCVLR